MKRVLRDLLFAPVEIIPVGWWLRVKVISVAFIVGEPLYYFIWSTVFPEPKESAFLRASTALLAVPMMLPWTYRTFSRQTIERHWLLLCFYGLPFSFFALYRMNGYDSVWMASCVAMIYLLFYVTDWRLALTALLAAVPVVALFDALGAISAIPGTPALPRGSDLAILGFATVTAMGVAMSATNLRRERARASLATLGIMAHELRTPLATAALLAEAFSPSEKFSPERSREAARKLLELIKAMNALIDYQLTNARTMDLPESREMVDIAAIVESSVSDYPLAHPQLRETISLRIEDTSLYALGNPVLLRQVVHNLMSNAIKAVQAHGHAVSPGDITVVAKRDRAQGAVKIEVNDKGVGVPESELAAIFEPFQTSSNLPSHGLGLAFCRATMRQLGGQIWCTSTPAHGTTFHVRIPAAATPESRAAG